MSLQRMIKKLASTGLRAPSPWFRKTFSTSACAFNRQMPPRPTIDEGDIEENFLKGSGPGGQKINKTSSAVQLKHIPSGMVIKSQATRSRSQNRKIARRILAEKLEAIEKGPESRVALKAESKKRKKASKSKKAKRKYRALDGVEGDEEISDASEDRKTRAKEELEEGTA